MTNFRKNLFCPYSQAQEQHASSTRFPDDFLLRLDARLLFCVAGTTVRCRLESRPNLLLEFSCSLDKQDESPIYCYLITHVYIISKKVQSSPQNATGNIPVCTKIAFSFRVRYRETGKRTTRRRRRTALFSLQFGETGVKPELLFLHRDREELFCMRDNKNTSRTCDWFVEQRMMRWPQPVSRSFRRLGLRLTSEKSVTSCKHGFV